VTGGWPVAVKLILAEGWKFVYVYKNQGLIFLLGLGRGPAKIPKHKKSAGQRKMACNHLDF